MYNNVNVFMNESMAGSSELGRHFANKAEVFFSCFCPFFERFKQYFLAGGS